MKRIFKKVSIFGLFLFGTICLTSCEPINGEDITNKIFPNVWAMLAQLLAFLVLVILMIFLLYKPVKKFLNKRKEILDKEVEDTYKNKKEAEQNNLESAKNIADSKVEAKNIIDEAKAKADREKDQIILDAKKEAQEIVNDASIQAQKAKEEAEGEIKDQIVDTAILVSKEVLKREVSKEDNNKIVDDFIKELDSIKKDN